MSTQTAPAPVAVSTSRTVKIFRNQSFIEKAQSGIAEFMALTKQSIGSYWESSQSNAIGTGLTIDEQEILMPYVIDIPVEDRSFRQKVREFFVGISTSVPYKNGVELEIGLKESNSKPLSKTNLPLKPMDYIRYRHALKHPMVAKSAEEARGNQIIRFYIFDKTASEVQQVNLMALKDEAMGVYLQVKDDPKKVAQLITLMGIDPRQYVGEDPAGLRQQAFRGIVETDPQKIINTYKLDSFEERYAISMMVLTGVLNNYGSRYVIASNGEILGNDIDEAISRFKAAADKELIVALKASAQEAMRLGKKSGQK